MKPGKCTGSTVRGSTSPISIKELWLGPVSTLLLDEVICMPVVLAEHQDGDNDQMNALAREEQDEFFLAAAAMEANYVKKPLHKARRSSGRGRGRRLVRDTAFDA